MSDAEETQEGDVVITKRVARKQAYRERILKSSQEIFAVKGFLSTSVDEIASSAGVTKRTLYRYFPSKIALYTSMYDEYQSNLYLEVKKVIKMDLSSDDLIFKCFDVFFRFTLKNERFMRLYMWGLDTDTIDGDIPYELREKIIQNSRAIVEIVSDKLEQTLNDGRIMDVDIQLLIHTIVAINKGIFIHARQERFKNSQINTENLYEMARIILKRGITRPVKDIPKAKR